MELLHQVVALRRNPSPHRVFHRDDFPVLPPSHLGDMRLSEESNRIMVRESFRQMCTGHYSNFSLSRSSSAVRTLIRAFMEPNSARIASSSASIFRASAGEIMGAPEVAPATPSGSPG